MHLTRLIAPLDLRAILTHLGALSRLLALILVVPLMVALAAGEWSLALIFIILSITTFIVGYFRPLSWDPPLEIREGLVVTALAYLLFALIGSLPFCKVAPFADSFFEAMSGFTTTGLSVLDLNHLPTSLLFFRAYSQWIGGAGIIILSLVLLLGPGQTSFTLYTSEFGEENLVGNVIATARIVMKVYLGLTLFGFLAYLVAGMTPFNAILHIMATISTGGFSPHPDSIGQYQNNHGITITITLFMLAGAISFPLYYFLRSEPGRFLRDEQFRTLLLITGLAALFIIITTAGKPSEQIFATTSALTTTGFSITPPNQWSSTLWTTCVILMVIGGTAGSTAGGIKLFRLIIMAKLIYRQLLSLLLPKETVLVTKLNNKTVNNDETHRIFAFVSLYLAILALSTLLLVTGGFTPADAIFESASALGTVGLSCGITSPKLALGYKLLLIFNMWAGRLEILPVLISLYPGRWWRQRNTT
ncbi:MAG: TrkH family potassium uptake protein [Desulfobulbaceae bacterium]|nr:TrkH family potassium uptake protein [Desulfobulbaceae bacterium]